MNADFSLNDEKTHVPTGMGYDSEMLKLASGQVVGKYRLVEKAGEGGMGVVWKALDTVGNRFVGLKFVPAEIRYRDDAMTQMIQAFSRVQALNHTHICPVYGLEKDPTLGYYVVMKWLEGLSLDKLLKTDILGGKNRIVAILQAVAEALDYAHARNVLHRDVKPSNIFVMMKDGKLSDIFLIDFGLAAEIQDTLSQFSEQGINGNWGVNTSGTRPYMPPEQWRGEPQNAWTDQYALGVVAYELFAGQRPFLISDVEMLRLSILQDVPKNIDGVSEHINRAIQKTLAKKPEERFSSCVEFVSELKKPEVTEEIEFQNMYGNFTLPYAQIVTPLPIREMPTPSPVRETEEWTLDLEEDLAENLDETQSESEENSGFLFHLLFWIYGGILIILLWSIFMATKDVIKSKSDYLHKIVKEEVLLERYLGNATTLKIPEEIEGYPVTEIGFSAFSSRPTKFVQIPKTVKWIGCSAFTLSKLETITIPGNVLGIRAYAFHGCDQLKSVKISEGVQKIEAYAFSSCRHLKEVSIPESLTSLGCASFSGCASLQNISIPGSVEIIYNDTFYGCDCLKTVRIGDGVQKIKRRAFDWCKNLEIVEIPGSVTEIEEEAFRYCGKFTIYGKKGSEAERFATEAGIPFLAIENKKGQEPIK